MDVEQYLAGVAHRMDLGPSFVNERIMNAMHDIPHDKLFKLFDDFESNLAQNRQGIRNPAAYLVGMANRVRKQTGHPSTGMVMAELEAMFRSGHIYRQDMDERCIDMLKQLPEDKGMQALAELRSVDISTVKNMSAFFMSLMKKYTHSSRGGGGKGGGGSFGTSGGGGWEGEYGRYPEPPSRGMGRDDYYPPAERHDHHHGPPRVQPHDYRSQHEMHAPERSRDMSEGDGDNWPAPKVIPPELLYGFGADEYVPEIPRPLEGCNLPPLVQEELEQLMDGGVIELDDLDNRIMKELRTIPPHVALRVVKDFANLDKTSNVRSVSGFLMGIVKKQMSNSTGGPSSTYNRPGPDRGGGRDDNDYYSGLHAQRQQHHQDHSSPRRSDYLYSGDSAVGDRYHDRESDNVGSLESHGGIQLVNMEVGRLVGQGLIRHEDVDERVREYLAAQPTWLIKRSLSEFGNKDMSRINNKGNFLKGMVRKILEVEGSGGKGGGKGSGGGGRGYPQGIHQYSSPRNSQHADYFPPHQHAPPHQSYHDQYYQGGGGKGGGRGSGHMGGRY